MDLNPYEELGVDRMATEAEIRKAYRQRSKTAHPDTKGDRAEWDRVSKSLVVLTDPKKRKIYDETGRIEEDRPDNDRAAALQLIEQHIGEIVNGYIASGFAPISDPRKTDMASTLASRIRKEIRTAEAAVPGGEKVLTYLKDVSRRFRLKAGNAVMPEDDPIGRGFQRQIAGTEQQLRDLQHSIEVNKLALKIADGYAFEVDSPYCNPMQRTNWGLPELELTADDLRAGLERKWPR